MNYYNKTNYVSNSMLTERDQLLKGISQSLDVNENFRFGTLFDTLETEPDKYNPITRTIGQYVYDTNEVRQAQDMIKSLYSSAIYNSVVLGAIKQHEVYNDDTHFAYNGYNWQMPTRCKFDLYHPDLGIDLKTTACTSQSQFESVVKHFGYHRQAAFYMNTANQDAFILIGISKTYPYKVFQYKITKERNIIYNNGFYEMNRLAFEFIESHGKNVNYDT